MTFIEEERVALQAIADVHPTLRELRLGSPPGAARFLSFTRSKSENWPTQALLNDYLQSCEDAPTTWHPDLDGESAITVWLRSQEPLQS